MANPVTDLFIRKLSKNKSNKFVYAPDPAQSKEICTILDLSSIKNAHLTGQITAQKNNAWSLTAELTAQVTQACAITLKPVKTQVKAQILRNYVKDIDQDLNENEIEMLDETLEKTPEYVALFDVFCESLALNIPEYPKAAEANFDNLIYAGPETEALSDEDVKPFAALAGLRDKLKEGN